MTLDLNLLDGDKMDDIYHLESTNNVNDVPRVGMVFESEEKAYEFYNNYARRMGFSIRKSRLDKSRQGKVIQRFFVCSKEGFRGHDPRRVQVKKRRAIMRTGCLAHMIVKFQGDGACIVSDICVEHNHSGVSPNKVHLLRSQKQFKPAHAARILLFEEAGIRPADGIEFMSQEVGGLQNLGITDVEYRNFLRTKRMKDLERGDAQLILDYFKKQQLENPSFFYAIQLDSHDQMTNFFWADAISRIDYSYFGDVVTFDTTYRTNKERRPFAPFCGVNHHKQTILFGAAILLDETTDSFVWLFNTFLKAMLGKRPKTILTDQCPAMAKAMSLVMTDVKHRLCLWHILQNAARHLGHAYQVLGFRKDFHNCIYEYESEEEFSVAWESMLIKYDLGSNDWLIGLHELRKKWALVYGRDSFAGDMTTTQRSESINKFLKKFLERKLCLSEVLVRYEKAIAKRRDSELRRDFHSKETSPVVYIAIPMLKQAAKIYTEEIFDVFQREFQCLLLYNIEILVEEETICQYRLKEIDKPIERIVTYDLMNGDVKCSCKMFEFVGVVCRHVLKVLNHRNVNELNPQFFLKRWTKQAKSGIIPICNEDKNMEENPYSRVGYRYGEICRRAVNIASKASLVEEAYCLAINDLEKLLERVETIGMKDIEDVSTYGRVNELNIVDPISQRIGIAKGKEKGRPQSKRLKSGLEINQKKRKTKSKIKGINTTVALV